MIQEQFNSKHLLENPYQGTISSVFQPIFSPRTKKLIGYEALSRFQSFDGKSEMPHQVFQHFKNSPQAVILDRTCRQIALRTYHNQFIDTPEQLLFLNFDSSIIDLGVQGSGFLLQQVEELAIPHNRVVIEIIESRVSDVGKLLDFVQKYRELGFFIALDDVGSGYSNLERLAQIHPHIIKIDRSIISGIHRSFAKEKIFQAIIQLSHSLGALALAEGIESDEEALACLELGSDFVQGFYFAHPGTLPFNEANAMGLLDKILDSYSTRYIQKSLSQRNHLASLESATRNVAGILKDLPLINWDQQLLLFLSDHQEAECAYILDSNGIQVTETNFCHPIHVTDNPLFHPSKLGADHSAKPYFLQTRRTPSFILSDSYISLATGKVCQTLVLPFRSVNNKSFRLCLDISLP